MDTNNCANCRNWYGGHSTKAGQCRGSTPFAGTDGMAVWPVTKADDGCGRYRSRTFGTGVEPKISTEEILAKLKEDCDESVAMNSPARAMRRSDFADWMCNERGMTMNPAIARLTLLRRRGLLGMGYSPPEQYPIPLGQLGKKAIFLWPVVEAAAGADYSPEQRLLVKLRDLCPAGSPPQSMRSIHRSLGGVLELSLSSVHRLLHKLSKQGRVLCYDDGWVCAKATEEVEVDA